MTMLVGLGIIVAMVLVITMLVNGVICMLDDWYFSVFDKVSVGFVCLVGVGTLLVIARKIGEVVLGR